MSIALREPPDLDGGAGGIIARRAVVRYEPGGRARYRHAASSGCHAPHGHATSLRLLFMPICRAGRRSMRYCMRPIVLAAGGEDIT